MMRNLLYSKYAPNFLCVFVARDQGSFGITPQRLQSKWAANTYLIKMARPLGPETVQWAFSMVWWSLQTLIRVTSMVE